MKWQTPPFPNSWLGGLNLKLENWYKPDKTSDEGTEIDALNFLFRLQQIINEQYISRVLLQHWFHIYVPPKLGNEIQVSPVSSSKLSHQMDLAVEFQNLLPTLKTWDQWSTMNQYKCETVDPRENNVHIKYVEKKNKDIQILI